MAKLPGSEGMLRGLTRFDAHRRWSVSNALSSRLFAPHVASAASARSADESAQLRFDDYMEDGA